jgi:mitochondrial chaperone BCS1
LRDTPAQPNLSSDSDYITTLLGGDRFTKGRKLLNTAATALALYELGRRWRDRGRAVYEHSIAVPQDDDIYAAVHEYVLAQLRPKKRRSMTLRSYLSSDAEDSSLEGVLDDGNSRRVGKVRLYYDGTREQRIKINGHGVRVRVEEDERAGNDAYRGRGTIKIKRERIIFYTATTAGREAVTEWLRSLAVARNSTTRSRLFIGMSWGGWSRLDTRAPTRPLDTVILADGQRERILEDMRGFLADEELYMHRGIPWHRGYLLHGPPGTGKTSLAKALAEHLELDLYYIPLSDLREDSHLIELLAGVSQRSVLIIEDIDVVHAAKSGDDSEVKGVTLAGLLQALDGMITPHGLITILTTNKRADLDARLIRDGRIDVEEKLGPVDDDQARRIVEVLLDRQLERPLPRVPADRVTPAELAAPAKDHLHDDAQAEQAIRDYLQGLAAVATTR